jgi:hypothetical protein
LGPFPPFSGTPVLMNTLVLTIKTGIACGLFQGAGLLARPLAWIGWLLLIQYSGHKGDLYNILWALVFGFATLNILGLVARRFEPDRTRLSFGEMMAVMVVLLSIFLLGSELLNVLHIFPIKLSPR